MIIENSQREERIEGSSDRVFGLIFASFFAIIAFLPILSGGQVRVWALAIAVVFLFLGLIWPLSLSRLNRLWMRLGLLLGKIVSPVALGVVFYLTVMPIGLVLRLLGRNPLPLNFNPSVSSYWVQRIPPGPDPSTLDKQF